MRARHLIAAGVPALVLTLGLASASPGSRAGEGKPDERPNFVVVVTDDQDMSSFSPALMPNTFRLMRDGGTRLSDFTVTTPLCCPSRSTLLTGQYAHNHGVLSNSPGYPRLRDSGNVLPAWMRRAGYLTAHVGRFLNGYKRSNGVKGSPAPGWERWITLLNLHYRDYDLSLDGEVRKVRGSGPHRYATRDLHRRADRLLRQLSASSRPFYLQFDELAPHSDNRAGGSCLDSSVPGPGGLGRVAGLIRRAPRVERNVADKPAHIRGLPRITTAQHRKIRRHRLCRAAALLEVDRGIGRLVDRLRDLGEYQETVFVFFSDNGFFNGEHRVVKSKGLPYEEAIEVPAFVRVPAAYLGSAPPRRIRPPSANIDLAPTILDLAGARPCVRRGCRRLDGRSLVGALDGTDTWTRGREIMVEVDQRGRVAGGTLVCRFEGVRTRRQVYVEYRRVLLPGSSGCSRSRDVELYDLRRDPAQHRNLWPPERQAESAAQARLRAALGELRRCNGNTHLPAELNPRGAGPRPCE